MLETNYKTNTMQYNMCKGPHFCFNKEDEGLIFIP